MTFIPKAKGCQGCPLENEVTVMPEGDLRNAKLVIVGQNPGPEERKDGRPFIGPCGEFLFPMLEEVTGLKREDCYITNCNKCTDPTSDTIPAGVFTHCFEQWKEEWAQMVGKRVLLLGGVATKKFFRSSPRRGTFTLKDGTAFLTVYHPAWALYSGNHDFYRKDLELVNSLLKWTPERRRIQFEVVKTPNGLYELVARLSVGRFDHLSFDIETNMKSPYDPTSRILSIAFSDGVSTVVVDWDGLGVAADSAIKAVLVSEVPKIAQNAKFELQWLKSVKDIEVNNVTFDPMLAQFILDEGNNPSVALNQIVWRHFPEYAGYEEGVDLNDTEHMDRNLLWEKNATDAFVTHRLADLLRHQLNGSSMTFLYDDVIIPTMKCLADMERSGMLLNKESVRREKEQLASEIQTIEDTVKTRAEELNVDTEDYNIHSVYWLRRLFFEGLKLEPISMTTKGNVPSLNYDVLFKYSKQGVPEADMILNFRSLSKVKSTYYEAYESLVSPDGYLHCNYSQATVITGRLSCWNPNLQNVPGKVRRVFPSRFENGLFLEADFRQIEMRIMACESKDRNLIDVFLSGQDPHAMTASLITGVPIDVIMNERQELRGRAKATNFGILYGMTPEALAYRESMPYDEARRFHDGFFIQYPGVKLWQENQEWKVTHGHKITSLFGRVWDFSTLKEDEKLTRSFNYPIQSAASDVTVYTMGLVWQLMREQGLHSRLVANVHDSLLVDCPRDEVDKVKKIMHVVCNSLPNQFSWMACPMEIDVKIGPNWEEVS